MKEKIPRMSVSRKKKQACESSRVVGYVRNNGRLGYNGEELSVAVVYGERNNEEETSNNGVRHFMNRKYIALWVFFI